MVTVLRIEHQQIKNHISYIGPYSPLVENKDTIKALESSFTGKPNPQLNFEKLLQKPAWAQEIWHNKPAGPSSSEISGFSHVGQLLHWFSEKELVTLAANNFVLREYTLLEEDIWRGVWQLAFSVKKAALTKEKTLLQLLPTKLQVQTATA